MRFMKFGKALLMSALSLGTILGITSCVQSYTVGYLYVTGTTKASTNGNGIISGFKIDHNKGNLTAINGLPISSGGANPNRAVLLSGGQFIYVLNRGVAPDGTANCDTTNVCTGDNITQFAIGGNGILSTQETFYPQGKNPERLIADSTGSYLMVLDHDAPDSASYTGVVPSAGSPNSCMEALGQSVTSCADVTVFKINATTGRLTLVLNAQVTSASGTPLSFFPVPSNPIDFVLSSSTLLTLSGTPGSGDEVFPYTYNASTGQLTINSNPVQGLPNITKATAIVAAGGVIYVLDNEAPLGDTTGAYSQILAFTTGSNGYLQAEPNGVFAEDPSLSNPAYLILENKGKWLYVANQGNNTDPNNAQSGIAAYTIQSPYNLTPVANGGIGSTTSTGAGPQCIVEDPSYQFIYTANFNDSTVTGRKVDQGSGNLLDLTGSANKTYPLNGPATWCLVTGRTS